MLSRWLPFEKPLVEIEEQLDEIKRLAASDGIDEPSRQKLRDNIERLEKNKLGVMRRVYSDLSPWDKVQMARHPNRPYSLDFIGA